MHPEVFLFSKFVQIGLKLVCLLASETVKYLSLIQIQEAHPVFDVTRRALYARKSQGQCAHLFHSFCFIFHWTQIRIQHLIRLISYMVASSVESCFEVT